MTARGPNVGDVLDARYRIVGRLGSGGMGSVYRAEHLGIRRPVAIKVLNAEVADDPEFARRFEREARVTGQTRHPNCVTVSDFGKLGDGSYYLVMELVDGVVLADLLDEEERLPPARALHIARHILRGLGHVHAAGIVHRDIKPTNVILVSKDGDPDFAKLLDFGIAKVVADDRGAPVDGSQLTRVGTTVGTPTYVAPEQAIGDRVDGRSDLYSLSVMLYLMLTGEPPFSDDDVVKLLAKHLSAAPPPMLSICPDLKVSREVEELVRRGMAKDRRERWQSAEDYVAAIDAVIAAGKLEHVGGSTPTPWPTATPLPGTLTVGRTEDGTAPLDERDLAEVASAAPITATGITRTPAARRRWVVGGAAAALVAVVGISLALRRQASEPSPASGASRGRVEPGATVGDALAADADLLLENGRAREAVELLTGRPEIAGHAGAQLRLGHALAATDRSRDAIEAYGLSLGLDGAGAEDSILRANLAVMSKGRELDVALPALGLLAVRLGDPAARARVIEMAGKDKRNAWRWRARAMAERNDWLAEVDRLSSYALDLQNGKTCDERRKAVPRLAELGDRRAVPALERARRRTSGGILGIGASRANGCMTADLDRAIEALSREP